jgi:hypothetical protein
MSRAAMRRIANEQGATWSIQDGKLQMIPLTDYLPSQAVQLNSLTGLIGFPEQTDEGIRIRTLINPRIRVGTLVQINNKEINQTIQQNPNAVPLRYDQWAGIQQLARVTEDGYYRVFVAEHHGDSRGQPWYSDLICLAVRGGKVEAKA